MFCYDISTLTKSYFQLLLVRFTTSRTLIIELTAQAYTEYVTIKRLETLVQMKLDDDLKNRTGNWSCDWCALRILCLHGKTEAIIESWCTGKKLKILLLIAQSFTSVMENICLLFFFCSFIFCLILGLDRARALNNTA